MPNEMRNALRNGKQNKLRPYFMLHILIYKENDKEIASIFHAAHTNIYKENAKELHPHSMHMLIS
jgi:hypothetical protein